MPLQLGFGAAERGDVGERGDEAAAGHRVAADLDDAAVRETALGDVRRAGAHVREALVDFGVASPVAGEPLRRL